MLSHALNSIDIGQSSYLIFSEPLNLLDFFLI